MAEELPDDMQDLLDQLDAVDAVDAVTHELEAPNIPISVAAKAPPPVENNDDLMDELEDAAAPPDGIAMRPVDERNMDAFIEKPGMAAPATLPQPSSFAIDISEHKEQLSVVTKEILDASRSDRQEAQEVINVLRDMLTANGPSKAVIDGLVQALAVKTSIHTNSIRIMETNTKFISAAKSQIKIEQNLTVDGAELSSILDGTAEDV